MERIFYMKKMRGYFTRTELLLWGASSALIAVSFAVFDRKGWLTLAAPGDGEAAKQNDSGVN